VAPGRYYLLASATSFMINGTVITADACFGTAANCNTAPTIPNFFDNVRAAGLLLRNYSDNAYYDSLCWDDDNNIAYTDPGIAAEYCEGISVPNYLAGGRDGLQAGNQIVRVSTPGASLADMWTYGRAYDSNDNTRDFLYPSAVFDGLVFTPRSTNNSAYPTITGKVSTGAYISASDPNSGSTITYAAYITSGSLSLPYSRFVLPGVSTGIWTVSMAYGSYAAFIDTVAVTQGANTKIPNATTVPAWLGADLHHTQLASSTLSGFVKGVITNTSNVPINGITVQGGGGSKITGSNGVYFMPVSSGTVTIIANPNNLSPSYVQGIETVTITEGAVTTQNFTLNLGGRITGYVTTGTTPLAFQAIAATNGAGSQAGSGVTDTGGNFILRNISTGTYTVFPVLESGQDVSPNTLPAILTSAGSVFAGTFTVSGAFGSIGGTITDAAGLVTSGALLLASTNTIAAAPAAIVGSSAPAQVPMYMVSSKADGTYLLPVRGGATYYLSAYVPVIDAAGSVTVTTKTYTGIIVSASASTTQNVVLP